MLRLSPEAHQIWVSFHNEVEVELNPTGDMADTRDVASKAGDNAARIAAQFHVFEYGPSGDIGPNHMQVAAQIVAWHLYEARRFLNQLTVPDEIKNALALERWMLKRCREEKSNQIPNSDIQQYGPNRVRLKEVLDAAIDELEKAGRAKRAKDGRKNIIQIRPELLEG